MTPLPASVVDLSNWYLTLPTGKAGHPETVHQPALANYADPHFGVNATGDAIVFTGPCDGVTTVHSHYPRSELRETRGNALAGWSCAKGGHEMVWTGAVTHLPEHKPEVVIGQIHDAKDDVVMLKCSGKTIIFVNGDKDGKVLDPAYVLGTKYTAKIHAEKGVIDVYYNDMAKPAVSIKDPNTKADNYFKVGCYTQSNATKGAKPGEYAQTHVYAAKVTHTQ
jgi:hypothetical protein